MTRTTKRLLAYLERKKCATLDEICAALAISRAVAARVIRDLHALRKIAPHKDGTYRLSRVGAPKGNRNAASRNQPKVAAETPQPPPPPSAPVVQPATAKSVLPPSSIRQLTKAELMRGRA